MRNSWWNLGEEGIGFQGDSLEIWRIACPFCGEKGNFSGAFHGEKKKPNSNKKLNFDVLKCANCAGFVHVMWSSSEHGYGTRRLYNYEVLPWPLAEKPEPSKNWPKGMHHFWVQAHDSLTNENWDAAALMARSALQFVMRHKGAKKGKLKQEIQDLVGKGVLQPVIGEWSHEVRELANDAAHPEVPDPSQTAQPTEDQKPTEPQDARDILNFLDFLLFYLYDLPEQIKAYRQRKESPAKASP